MKMRIHPNDAVVFREGLDHPECVAVHPDGSVWAGGEAGQIYRISADGKEIDEVAGTGGFVLGMAFDPSVSWLAVCDLAKRCVWRLDLSTGELTTFADGFGIPNFPVFDRQGNLYISDSGEFRKVTGTIHRFDRDGHGGVWHEGPFNFANGMALAPDGKAIFVVCTWLPGVERIEICPDGSPGTRSVYVTFPKTCPDGCAFDVAGNLYVSCYSPARIYQVAPGGDISVLIDDWEAHTISNPTNIAFGGPAFDQLFIANLGRWHITRLDMGVKGAPLACHVPR